MLKYEESNNKKFISEEEENESRDSKKKTGVNIWRLECSNNTNERLNAQILHKQTPPSR